MSAEQYPPPPPPPPNYPPPPSYQGPPPADSGNRTVMLVLSYLGLFALIPLLVEKNDREVQWHAKHGLVLTAASVVLWIVLTIVTQLLAYFVPPLGCIFAPVFMLLFLAQIAFFVYCMVQAVNGKRVLVPGVSEYADKF